MKILKIPKFWNKKLCIKETCSHCKTKVIIDDLIDVIPGSIVLDYYGSTEYQNFQYICPSCKRRNDVIHRTKLSKYLKHTSIDLYDQVREFGEMMMKWNAFPHNYRTTPNLHKIMCLAVSTGMRIDPDIEKYSEYNLIHKGVNNENHKVTEEDE